jgi:thiamine biosynthesis protein ThiI
MLAFRRFVFAVAEAVAADLDAVGIVTGEAIGQKSSQTATNLRVTSAATELPIHRPLVSMDKSAITERARDIGTFDDATIPAGCNRVAPSLPATTATLEAVREAEPSDLFDRARTVASQVDHPDGREAAERSTE